MFKKVSIYDIAELNNSNIAQDDNFTHINYLDTGNITKNKIDTLQLLEINKDKIPSRAKRKVKQKTIIYSTVRPNQEHYGFIDETIENLIVSTGFTTIDCIDSNIDAKFLYYYLSQSHIVEYFQGIAENSVSSYPSMKPEDIGNLYINIPTDIYKQQKIAKVLSTLDKKIELNNQINQNLEAMAKTLYDYWFVQFDFPNANGKPYKSSGGKMVYSEELKREIPEGWGVKELGEIENNIVTGKTPPTKYSEYYGGDIPFISIGDIRGNMHIVTTEATLTDEGANSQIKKYIPKGSICVTCIASPGLVAFASKDSQTNQQINTVVCNNFENRYYLYFSLKNYFKFAKAKTGNTFANMNKQDFSEILIVKPSQEVLMNFSKILKPSIESILNNLDETQKLTQLIDWLLPMLMNGQVTVADATEQAEELMVAEPSVGYGA